PFDGLDLRAGHLNGQQQAGADGDAAEPDRAGAADAVLAADVRAGQPECVPEEVREQQARLHLLAVSAAVDGQLDRDHPVRSRARLTARSTRTGTRWRRYSGGA